MTENQNATGTKLQEIAVWLLCVYYAHHSLSACGWHVSKASKADSPFSVRSAMQYVTKKKAQATLLRVPSFAGAPVLPEAIQYPAVGVIALQGKGGGLISGCATGL